MSLLIGAHLSDRIYLCADTRISKQTETGLVPVHNNILKIIYMNNDIGVGCVGSPRLGAFIIDQIKRQQPNAGIRNLEAWLKDNAGELVHKYLITPRKNKTNPTNSEANVALVFAGLDKTRKKKISANRLIEVSKRYQEAQDKKINSLFGGKPIEQYSQSELSRFTYEMMRSQMGLKDVIVRSLKNTPSPDGIELPISDQCMFLLEIRADKVGDEIKFKTIEFGDVVVRGGGYNENHIAETFFGDIDLNMNSGNLETDLVPFIAEIHDRFSTSIGGSITNMVIVRDEVMSLWNRWARMPAPSGPQELLYHSKIISGEPYHLIEDLWHKLNPFTDELDVDEQIGELVL